MKSAFDIKYRLLLLVCRTVGALPYWFLYGWLQDFIYLIIYHVVRYRRSVVISNLAAAFPEKSDAERLDICKRFYRHLAEVFIDTLVLVSISSEELKERIVFENSPQVESQMDGRSWIAALAHYGSWEYFMAYQLHTSSQVVGIYHPLHDRTMDKLYLYSRSRFGAQPVPMKEVLKFMYSVRGDGKYYSLGLIADQSPARYNNTSPWFRFLNQDTLFMLGIEKIALKFGMPVWFVEIKKVRRAHYSVNFRLIYDGQEPVKENEITARYAANLEEMIRREPHLWMWSHRRWKHKRHGNEQQLPEVIEPAAEDKTFPGEPGNTRSAGETSMAVQEKEPPAQPDQL